MRKIIFIAMTMLSFTVQARIVQNDIESTQDVTLSPFAVTLMSTLLSACSSSGCKILVEAQEDLAYFVASEGAVRTAGLEVAMNWARSNFELSSVNDLEVAQALLGTLAAAQ